MRKGILFIIIIFVISLFLLSCKEKNLRYDPDKPTEFFSIEQSEPHYPEESIKYYVIVNVPYDEMVLLDLIERYCRETISVDTIKEKSCSRDFYRETEYLTRNYKRGVPYPANPGLCFGGEDQGQQLVYHDSLIMVHYYRSYDGKTAELECYWPGLDNKEYVKQIYDIESYFSDRR